MSADVTVRPDYSDLLSRVMDGGASRQVVWGLRGGHVVKARLAGTSAGATVEQRESVTLYLDSNGFDGSVNLGDVDWMLTGVAVSHVLDVVELPWCARWRECGEL